MMCIAMRIYIVFVNGHVYCRIKLFHVHIGWRIMESESESESEMFIRSVDPGTPATPSLDAAAEATKIITWR